MADKVHEYQQCMNMMQYFLDYRTKVFNFCIIINGGLLTVSAVHPPGPGETGPLNPCRSGARRFECEAKFRARTATHEHLAQRNFLWHH